LECAIANTAAQQTKKRVGKTTATNDRDIQKTKAGSNLKAAKEKATCKKVALGFLKPVQGFHKFFSGLKAGFFQGKTW